MFFAPITDVPNNLFHVVWPGGVPGVHLGDAPTAEECAQVEAALRDQVVAQTAARNNKNQECARLTGTIQNHETTLDRLRVRCGQWWVSVRRKGCEFGVHTHTHTHTHTF